MPDEIWVGDKFAYRIANKTFNNTQIKIIRNPYFEKVIKEYKSIKNQKKPTSVLFISEPINVKNIHSRIIKNTARLTEYDVFKECLDSIRNTNTSLILRKHPSEKISKYDGIIKKYKIKVIRSKKNLSEDFARSKVIVGMESMVLVLAHLCGKKTIRVVPKRPKTNIFPYKEIQIVKPGTISSFLA